MDRDTTDRELQAEYNMRHQNLMHSVDGAKKTVSDTIQNALDEGHHASTRAQERLQENTTRNNDLGDSIGRTVDNAIDGASQAAGRATQFATGAGAGANTGHHSTSTGMSAGVGSHDDMKPQHQATGFGGDKYDKSAMDAVRRDFDCLHDADPQKFEPVGAKIEDTLGGTALTDDSMKFSQHHG